MPIKSKSTALEKSSPFYKRNKKLCEDWEDFIISRGGKINAVYNAWSVNLKSKVKSNRTWLINVDKATYSNGVLIFSAKYQNLEEILEFQTLFPKTECPNFYFGKSRWRRRSVQHPFFQQVMALVQPEIEDKSLLEAKLKNGLLTIRFQHKNDDFELVERILANRFIQSE